MNSAADIICIDLGTTNTRVWRVSADGDVRFRGQAQVGVRDTAREGSSKLLRETLRSLIDQAIAASADIPPVCVIAAGMITSSLGLLEIPHIPAPAGVEEIAAATRAHHFVDVTNLPIYLVPGVRCGSAETINDYDIMRGEETLCIGLKAMEQISGETTVLNLGSHWKAISVSAAGQITGSTTSLAGEMIYATQTNTILASALPAERPDKLDASWVLAGMEAQRHSGLSRSLFQVRLLQLANRTSPQQRFSYMIGAFIAADLDALLSSGKLQKDATVLIAGNAALAAAWNDALALVSIDAISLSPDAVEKAMLAALSAILKLSN